MFQVEQRTSNDCLRACLASVLEVPYDEVPSGLCAGSDSVEQHNICNGFLRDRGFALWDFGIWGDERPYLMYGGDKINFVVSIPGHWIASVQSPRNEDWHCVVMYGSEIVWDPHPQREMGHGGFQQAHVITKL